MIVLLGGSGYIGQAFQQALRSRQWPYRSISRQQLDYTQFGLLLEFFQKNPPSFVINAAGYTPASNVDACETAQAETLLGNTLFPQTVAHVCSLLQLPWGHVSSGCIYSGAKISDPQSGSVRIEKNLMRPEIQDLLEHAPAAIRGYCEIDQPNFTFRQPPCSFYSGAKALAEEIIAPNSACARAMVYSWRLRLPFDEFDHPRNLLTKLQRYPKIYDNVNSLSHRGDFARACLDLWERRAPFGIYNITNTGYVRTRRIIEMIQQILKPQRPFDFWNNDAEFYRFGARARRSNCVLDVSKLLNSGVAMRPVETALDDALNHWKLPRKLSGLESAT